MTWSFFEVTGDGHIFGTNILERAERRAGFALILEQGDQDSDSLLDPRLKLGQMLVTQRRPTRDRMTEAAAVIGGPAASPGHELLAVCYATCHGTFSSTQLT
jgi:hypothetical protein